jgi:hypothetical protein
MCPHRNAVILSHMAKEAELASLRVCQWATVPAPKRQSAWGGWDCPYAACLRGTSVRPSGGWTWRKIYELG